MKERWTQFASEDVAEDITLEFELLALAFASGINDATTFPDYNIFVSNQTGNTVLLAIGALGLGGEEKYLPNVGISLGLFVAGGIVFGQFGDWVGRRKRWWLITTNLIQTVLISVAAALRHWFTSERITAQAWSIISLLALASGGQVAMARTVNIPEITTAMVTSAYIDVLVDPKLFQLRNHSRNRRVLFVLCLLLGSFIGAAVYRFARPSLSLLLVAIIRSLITATFVLNKAVTLPTDQNIEVVEQAAPTL